MKKAFVLIVLIFATFLLAAQDVTVYYGEFAGDTFGYPNASKGEPVNDEKMVSDRALKISMPPSSWAGFVMSIGSTDISDMRKKGSLEFWIKGTKGNEKDISVMLIDSAEDKEPFHSPVVLSDYVKISTEWQQVVIPLADFLDDAFFWSMEKNARVNGKIDWKKIESVSFDLAPSETTQTVIYVDGVMLTDKSGSTKITDKYADFEKKYAYEGVYKKPVMQENQNFKWPKKYKAAVSLTHDDGYISCVTNAFPLLQKYKLNGTFFMSGFGWYQPDNIEGWKEVFEAGNEIGNHTFYHLCDRAMGFMKNGFAAQDYTMGRLGAEIEGVTAELEKQGFTSKRGYSFAYPCGQTTVGEDKKSYVPMIEKNFIAARTVEPAIADPKTVYLPLTPAYDGAGMTLDTMKLLIKQAEATGGWLVFYFHGVGADLLPVDLEKYEALLKYLSENKDKLWTGTFGEVAEYVKDSRK